MRNRWQIEKYLTKHSTKTQTTHRHAHTHSYTSTILIWLWHIHVRTRLVAYFCNIYLNLIKRKIKHNLSKKKVNTGFSNLHTCKRMHVPRIRSQLHFRKKRNTQIQTPFPIHFLLNNTTNHLTCMNWIVIADLPTPPPPTTTSL